MAPHTEHWLGKEATVSEIDFDDMDAEALSDTGGRAPRGLNLQVIATGLLVLALLAIAWLFLADSGQEPASATATPQLVGAQAALALTRTVAPSAQPTAATPSLVPAAPAVATVPGSSPAGTTGIVSGGFVRVQGTDTYGLRLRYGPGPDYATIRIVSEGEVFRVLGGPESAPPDTFWRVQDAAGNIGWAAGAYLAPTAAPALWSPPVATPLSGGAAAGAGSTAATATP